MKLRYQFLVAMLLMLVCLLAGCSRDELFLLGQSSAPSGGSCPFDYTCFDVSNASSNPYVYNVSSSLDEPYVLDVRA